MQVTAAVRLNIQNRHICPIPDVHTKKGGRGKKVSYNHFAPGRKHCSPMAFETSCHSSLIYDVSPRRMSAFRVLEKLGCAGIGTAAQSAKLPRADGLAPILADVRASRTINSRREKTGSQNRC